MYDAAPEVEDEILTWWQRYQNDCKPETRNDFLRACARVMGTGANLSNNTENLYTSGECVKKTGDCLQVLTDEQHKHMVAALKASGKYVGPPTKETAECGVDELVENINGLLEAVKFYRKALSVSFLVPDSELQKEVKTITTERDALKAELMEAVGLIQQAPVHVTKDGVWLNIRPDVKAKIGAAMFKIDGPEAEVLTHWKNRIDTFLSKHRDGQGEG